MVQSDKLLELRRQRNEDRTTKKLRTIHKHLKIDEEKHALDSLDNLLILTFFSILFPTILQFNTILRFDYFIVFVMMLAVIFLFTFKGIAENNTEYRIWAWLSFLFYISLLFNLIISEYFPRERWSTTFAGDKIILTNSYNHYNLFPWFAMLLISGYFSSKAMIYIIRMYIKRAPISSKQTIDKMLSNPRAGIGYLLFFNDRKFLLLGLFLLIISVILFING